MNFADFIADFTNFKIKTGKPRIKDFENLEFKLNSFDSKTSNSNQPVYETID